MCDVTKDSFFVLHCHEDDSHVLVDGTAVIFDESVEINDKVKFAYPGIKNLLEGTVKGYGENKKEMIKLQDELNKSTKPKRDSSFHEDKPRRAALKCREIGFKCKSSRAEPTSIKAVEPTSNRGKVLMPTGKASATSAATRKGGSKSTGRARTSKSNLVVSSASSKPLSGILSGSGSDSDSRAVPILPGGSGANCHGTQKRNGWSRKTSRSDSTKPSPLSQLLSSQTSDSSSSSDSDSPSNVNAQSALSTSSDVIAAGVNILPDMDCSSVQATDVDDSASSSSSEELTQEERLLLAKLTKRNRKAENKFLMALSSGSKEKKYKTSDLPAEKDVTAPEGQGSSKSNVVKSDLKDKPIGTSDNSGSVVAVSNNFTNNFHEDSFMNMEEMDQNNVISKAAAKITVGVGSRKRKPAAQPPAQEFQGEFYIYNAGSSNVVKLSPDCEVYISIKDMKACKKKCNTSTALVRFLLRSVFTLAARTVCSVSGRPHLNAATGEMERRPALDSNGVDAIIDFTTARADKKGWPKPSDSGMKQSMNNLLCESRAEMRFKAEREASMKEGQSVARKEQGTD